MSVKFLVLPPSTPCRAKGCRPRACTGMDFPSNWVARGKKVENCCGFDKFWLNIIKTKIYWSPWIVGLIPEPSEGGGCLFIDCVKLGFDLVWSWSLVWFETEWEDDSGRLVSNPTGNVQLFHCIEQSHSPGKFGWKKGFVCSVFRFDVIQSCRVLMMWQKWNGICLLGTGVKQYCCIWLLI